MEATHSYYQSAGIKESLLAGALSAEEAIQKLIEGGYEPNAAHAFVAEITRQNKQELFNNALQRKKREESKEISFFVVMMISIIGPVFEIQSAFWYMIVLVVAGTAGYLGYKNKPIAGIGAFLSFALLFPFTYSTYFTGRTSFLRIEMVIPVLMAAVPAFLLLLLLSKIFYSNQEN